MKFGSQYGCGVQSVLVSAIPTIVFRKLTELSDVHDVVLILQNSSLVVVHIQVIGRAEDGHHAREASGPSLSVHAVPSVLSFVCANDGQEIIFLEESACGGVREEV